MFQTKESQKLCNGKVLILKYTQYMASHPSNTKGKSLNSGTPVSTSKSQRLSASKSASYNVIFRGIDIDDEIAPFTEVLEHFLPAILENNQGNEL